MTHRVSRVWLGFADLEQATRAYTRLGFRVVQPRLGGKALIFLADGVVLELFSLAHLPFGREEDELLERRRHFYAGKMGLLDYALGSTAALEQASVWLEGREIPHRALGGRLLPQLLVCPPPLPLWLGPLTPQPGPEQTQHPNGVTGLHALVVGSPAYPAALAQHRRLLGPPLGFENHEGQRRAVFAVGEHFIYLQGAEREGLSGLILRSRYALWGRLEAEQTLGVPLMLLGDPVFALAPEAD
ncbi:MULTISPECIES: glyoxalase/bleomycin resistance/dioxygenase family protein [unclassified Meiothermus]|uniref:glyoxalase/bleomycin resistance/dioxygenase family protein n=1 Tax=unclassified Meiothermus TaxID=370471 RepID=UPI0010211820|nr:MULTISPECIES: glyoxalase/bleomycin resistance/dioxygenase family protein [unclassified Meiothermus]RYM35219.1 glyoxalase/bleomycin resistance/dioxygenase family protein [Meiothermus sp. PNK-Is4]